MKNFGIFKNRYNKHGPALHAQSNCIVIFQLLAFSKNRLTCLLLLYDFSNDIFDVNINNNNNNNSNDLANRKTTKETNESKCN